jgi:hypothetical protein
MDRKQISFLIMSLLIAICYFSFAQKENDDLDLPPSLEDKPTFAQKENGDLDLHLA